ncbi:MAG TPA: IclR family transcriptional regulator C-terminal domain-containing protein [Acidimicrobiales bacterium]|nr:IclR family transcriptional regulator C-terminal domain-containing protein [Acidimicrobiales bacterium]
MRGGSSGPDGYEAISALANDGVLVRGLRVFRAIAESGSTNVATIASELEIPQSTVYRLVRTLKEIGLITERDNEYRVSRTFANVATIRLNNEVLNTSARPALETLSKETGETSNLLVRSGLSAFCVHEVQSQFGEGPRLPIGQPMKLHAGAEHRVLLAFAPLSLIDAVIDSGLPSYTVTTPNVPRLLDSLALIRQRRVAVSRGEYLPGVVAVGVPVFVHRSFVCSVGVAGPHERCTDEWVRTAANALAKTSLELSELLANA